MHPLELINAAPWHHVLFTTYSLSLSFFEGVVLDRLVRAGARQATILSDQEGVRAALQEQGARGVGRDYGLEPITCTTGAFHSKVGCLVSDEDCHLLVGSGNLTFGGWGSNLEVLEHLHPSFAGDAFNDAANFFEYLAIADNVRSGLTNELEPIVTTLRRVAASGQRNGDIRILSSIEGPLVDQIGSLADELGGATRLTVSAAFFDIKGIGLSRLATRLGVERCQLHVHDQVVQGRAGFPWPYQADFDAVTIEEPLGHDVRPLHAKCFEILCRRGRLMISGSANATQAALVHGNIETVVARIQRNRMIGWSTVVAKPPEAVESTTDEADDEGPQIGVLTATLDGEVLRGTVLARHPVGDVVVSVRTQTGILKLGSAVVAASGAFEVSAKGLESAAWSSGRMVAIVAGPEHVAEGFVSFGAALAIVRRAGAMAPRIFAMLLGTETPEDAAAVLSWFYKNPDLLPNAAAGAQNTLTPGASPAVTVTSEMLHGISLPTSQTAVGDSDGSRAWERAMAALLASFGSGRPGWSELSDDDEPEGDGQTDEVRQQEQTKREKAKQRVVKSFEALLDRLLKHNRGWIALPLAVYVASRVTPTADRARGWFNKILPTFTAAQVRSDRLISSVHLLLLATDGRAHRGPRARGYLLERGLNPDTYEVDDDALVGLVGIFQEGWDSEAFMDLVRHTKSPAEEVSVLLTAAASGQPVAALPILYESRHWARLKAVLDGKAPLNGLIVVDHVPDACPCCHITFTPMAADELRLQGVTEHCRLVVRTVRT